MQKHTPVLLNMFAIRRPISLQSCPVDMHAAFDSLTFRSGFCRCVAPLIELFELPIPTVEMMALKLGSFIHSTTQSFPDILHYNAITRAAMQNLDLEVKNRISTKLKLYNTCSLPIFLYGSEC